LGEAGDAGNRSRLPGPRFSGYRSLTMETPPRPFGEFLEEHLVVFDGGLGTELYRRGVFINKSFDELNLVNPKLVTEVHRSYVEAGADVIETNTFAANRVKLSQHGLAEQLAAINEQ